ncbi:hypothetical protein [Deinococcus sp. QL22]|uniref:hypothetical protein n=1 Tax=Deinococcus sp. QL22 TaxID=2939437 RepID=UPI00201811A2|nr:hypothetical protein [Deinococcus sp. QL22]UQN05222.1 hypothetical protein M1R55_10010 [Deinococcus sp. QL22]
MPSDTLANPNGDSTYVRVQILTPADTLDREQKLGVTQEVTQIIAAVAIQRRRFRAITYTVLRPGSASRGVI